jgi:trans-aconitate 2-methyltransferase
MVRLPAELDPRVIWDLGCGTGEHAALLARRHPGAEVHGLDASPAMLEAARAHEGVSFHLGDISAFEPGAPVDLIFANASLQWLPDHETLFASLCGHLAERGVLAVQMPMAHQTLHHRLMREVAGQGPWAGLLASVPVIAPLLRPERYYEILSRTCSEVEVWSTTYLHALEGDDAVLGWMQGTALRPYLTALCDAPMREAYLSALLERLAEAFPRRPDGRTLLPFPRLFLIARR